MELHRRPRALVTWSETLLAASLLLLFAATLLTIGAMSAPAAPQATVVVTYGETNGRQPG